MTNPTAHRTETDMIPARALLLAVLLVAPSLAPSRASADGALQPFTRKVRFECRAPDAKEVKMLGTMSGGTPQAIPLRRGDDWRWWAALDLPPGRWSYVFEVDGRTVVDGGADGVEPDGKGGRRSFITIRPDDVDGRPDPKVSHGSIERRTVRSVALDRIMPFNVYLPPGFDPTRRYPVLYLLHGMHMTADQWPKGGVQHYLDNLIAQSRIAPMLVVMPGVPPTSLYMGDTERFIVEELVPHVLSDLPAEPGPAAIAGMSMGGFGAFFLAFRHPDLFGHADALSPGGSEQAIEMIDAALAAGARFLPQLVVRCGKQDDLAFPFSEALVTTLQRRNVRVAHEFTRGAHDWDYWHGLTAPMLEEASRYLAGPRR